MGSDGGNDLLPRGKGRIDDALTAQIGSFIYVQRVAMYSTILGNLLCMRL